ncbi:MAG: 4a-hydroxytetrahydrobiopterin dehydratase [Methanomicrobiales archaeon]|nr:4a-hydroxytetrahydrobiopterin dehydratase [Methanomicrobiales archaeon]
MDLLYRKCATIEPGTPPLTRREIGVLLKEVPEWRLENGHLYRRFSCRDYWECVQCTNDVVTIAFGEGHFPDICITQGRYVDVLLYTYGMGGLSWNDFILAAKITTN